MRIYVRLVVRLIRVPYVTLASRFLPSPEVLRYPPKPVQHESSYDVEGDISPHNSKIPPTLAIIAANTRKERIGAFKWTEAAVARGIWILKSTSLPFGRLQIC